MIHGYLTKIRDAIFSNYALSQEEAPKTPTWMVYSNIDRVLINRV